MSIPRLFGMVHLAPLPGAPGFAGSMTDVVKAAVRDASVLEQAGFDALLVENFGDAPFFRDRVPEVTVAAMTRAVAAAAAAVAIPIGVNVLRNDGAAAVAIAAAVDASFVRINVLTGTMFTDQGAITGQAARVARLRSALAPRVAILADVFVKHAVPPAGLSMEEAAIDTWERGGADALIVSGAATGRPADPADFGRVRTAVPDAPLLAGSGVTAETVAELLSLCDGVIAGTDLKEGGATTNPVDPDRAKRFVEGASA